MTGSIALRRLTNRLSTPLNLRVPATSTCTPGGWEDGYSPELEESRATEFHQQPLAISFTTFKGKPLDDCKPSDVYFSRPASNELF